MYNIRKVNIMSTQICVVIGYYIRIRDVINYNSACDV